MTIHNLNKFFLLGELKNFRNRVNSSLNFQEDGLNIFEEKDNFLIQGATRSRKTTNTLRLSAYLAYSQERNVIFLGRTKKQLKSGREKLKEYVQIPGKDYYELILRSKSESCTRVSDQGVGHSTCSLGLNGSKKQFLLTQISKGHRDLQEFDEILDNKDICIPEGHEYLAKQLIDRNTPVFIFLTWEKLKYIMNQHEGLANKIIEDNIIIGDEFTASSSLNIRGEVDINPSDTVLSDVYRDINQGDITEDKVVQFFEHWFQKYALNFDLGKMKQVEHYLKFKLRRAYNEQREALSYPKTKRFNKEALPDLQEEVDKAFAGRFSETSNFKKSDIDKIKTLADIVDLETAVDFDIIESSNDLKLKMVIYDSNPDSIIESRSAIKRLTEDSNKIYLIDATPPTQNLQDKKELGHYYNPDFSSFNQIEFPTLHDHTVICGDRRITLSNIYQHKEVKENHLKFIESLANRLEKEGYSYKIFARSKREKGLIRARGVSDENLSYARSRESEGVNISKQVLILTGPPFTHPHGDRWRRKSIDHYTDLPEGDRNLRDYWAKSQIAQILGRNMMEDDSLAILLNMDALKGDLPWDWIDDLNYFEQSIKNTSNSAKADLMMEAIKNGDSVDKGEIIKKRIKEVLAANDEIGKTELIRDSVSIGGEGLRRRILEDMIDSNQCVMEFDKKMKRNKKKFIKSEFSKFPLPHPPQGFLPAQTD